MPQDDPTPNEEHLLRLLNFNSLADLNRFLSAPDNLEALNRMETPDELYRELTRAEEESEMVENLERLYAQSSPSSYTLAPNVYEGPAPSDDPGFVFLGA